MAKALQCVVVTPEATALEASAEFVALPLYDGELGVAPGRGPMIGRLGFGELRLRDGVATRRYYVDGGFVQVANDVITVLTNRAVEAEKLDASEADKLLEAAQKRPSATAEQGELKERAVAQARAQVRLSRRK